ncbi:MAG: 5-formyltetrahydrofolate cyclo-ligase [Oscillospiraceae bacterium]|nr:5-formyltetrahydrofolate cyclo-ligase [Oscillospiraceae bacterium]
MNKCELRQLMKEKKRAMTPEQIEAASVRLGELFAQCAPYQQAETIYFYLPYNQEVRTLPMIEKAFADGKRVAVPKVYGDEMRFIYIEDLSGIAKGSFGIPEPVADEPVANDPKALILMPGLAFDREGHRIGYGGGYYDKYLNAQPGHPTVALCYAFQMQSHLETEEFDIPVDLVLWA